MFFSVNLSPNGILRFFPVAGRFSLAGFPAFPVPYPFLPAGLPPQRLSSRLCPAFRRSPRPFYGIFQGRIFLSLVLMLIVPSAFLYFYYGLRHIGLTVVFAVAIIKLDIPLGASVQVKGASDETCGDILSELW